MNQQFLPVLLSYQSLSSDLFEDLMTRCKIHYVLFSSLLLSFIFLEYSSHEQVFFIRGRLVLLIGLTDNCY